MKAPDESPGRISVTSMPKSCSPKTTTTCAAFSVKALQNAGYDVASFDNGLSAYHRLREEPFELLLTDIVMPEMDGIELARRATELDPDIKVMFITGFAAVALNPDSRAPSTPRCCRSRSTCAISSTKFSDARRLCRVADPCSPNRHGRPASERASGIVPIRREDPAKPSASRALRTVACDVQRNSPALLRHMLT